MSAWKMSGIASNPEIITATVVSAAEGRYGCDIVSDTAAHTPPAGHAWCLLQAITATVIGAATFSDDPPHSGTLAGATLAAGVILRVSLTSITLTSGSVILYRDR